MDLIMFKTCNSLNIESAYELRNAADYLVGHESLGISGHWDMSDTIEYVYDDPSRTAEEIADKMVATYYHDNKNPSDDRMLDVVWAAVDTAKSARLAASMDAFVQTVLSNATPGDWDWLETCRSEARSWGDMLDIGSYMEWVIDGGAAVTASIRGAAAEVQNWREATCFRYAYIDTPASRGLAVYHPATPRMRYEYDFRQLEFALDWDWEELFLVDDDVHEQDDAHWLADEQDALDPMVFFDGISWDNDYFRIWVPQGQEHVQIVCNFSDPDGDINLYLLDKHATQIAASESTNSNESIHFTVPKHGKYYIRVASDADGNPIGQDYALRWQHSAPTSAPGAAPEESAVPGKIDVELVVLLAESGVDTSPTLPIGLTEVHQYMPFVVEVWVANSDGSPNGITGGYVGIAYDDSAIATAGLRTGGIYTSFPAAEMFPGAIDDMGGQAPLGALEYGNDEWVRLGWIDFIAGNDEFASLEAYPGYGSFARANEGAIDEFDVAFPEFVEFDLVEGPPMVHVDLQADNDSGTSDSDNITNINTPTFEVIVNYDGTVRIDYDDDAVWDEIRVIEEPGTHEFTPSGPLGDGVWPVLVEFEAPGLGTDSDIETTTIATLKPQVDLTAPFDGETVSLSTINVHERYIDVTFTDLNGNGLDAATIVDGDPEFTLSGPAAAGVTINSTPILVGAETYRYFFTGDFTAGPVGVNFIAGSFADLSGNTNAADAEDFTVETDLSGVVGRHVFYNNSAWDGNDPAPGPDDDNAIALDKAVLLPLQAASPANYTSYGRGINGIMVDIDALPATPTADDFCIRVNQADEPDLWSAGPTPVVTVRAGQGIAGSDRVTLTWPDEAIVNQWVEVTVKSAPNTGLAFDDVFYLGNAVGDSDGDGQIGAGDYAAFGGQFGIRPGASGIPADFNADGRVDLSDFSILRSSYGNEVEAPNLMPTAPLAAPEVSTVNRPLDARDANPDSITTPTSAPAIDLISESLLAPNGSNGSASGYIQGTQAMPGGLPAITPYRAATTGHDLRPLGNDLVGDGQGADLLADILAESMLVVPLQAEC